MDDTVKSIARPAAIRSLQDAVRKARVEEAYQLDDTADRRDSEIARLELLKAELEAVFAEVPANDDRFTLMLVPSRPARLWIDLFTYGAIDETSGAYLFIRNSESGRRTLYSTSSVSEMADRITLYMAREIVRRERAEAALLEPLTREEQPAAAPPPARLGMGVVVCGLHHRPPDRSGRPVRRGVARHALGIHDSRKTRRSHSQTWAVLSATARPTISQRQPLPTLAMRYSL